MQNSIFEERYKILKHIGQGGMADVYQAYDSVLKREVAIKVLRGELSKDPTALLRFKREAHASSKLSHPNIVEIYDVGDYGNQYYIVMEYVVGKTLKELVLSRGALLKEEAIAIVKQITQGIEHAHKQGVIHRDIKPQNVIIKDDGTVKILDFGIALAHDALQLTQSDSVMGSVHYLAPELAKGENATIQSDIYSIGIVLYELLSGEVPFKGEQMVQVALQHMNQELPDIRAINPTIPQAIVNVLTIATAKNKQFRYGNASILLDDLNVCLAGSKTVKPVVLNHPQRDDQTMVLDKAKPVKTKKKKKKKNNLFLGFIVFCFAIFAIFLTSLLLQFSGVTSTFINQAEIPDVIGLTYEQAKQLIEDEGLYVNTSSIERILTEDVEKGYVIEVKQGVGNTVAKGNLIDIVISDGVYEIMPDYTEMNIDDATTLINNDYPNIRISKTTQENSELPPGTIISQELLEAGSEFDPTKSNDVRLVYVAYTSVVLSHSLIGMDVQEAKETLEALGVEVLLSALDTSNLSEEEKEALDYGTVIRLNPANGTNYTQTNDSFVTIFYY
ncbi:MAG: protein kinase [Erysipelotrichaceae bacterium]